MAEFLVYLCIKRNWNCKDYFKLLGGMVIFNAPPTTKVHT